MTFFEFQRYTRLLRQGCRLRTSYSTMTSSSNVPSRVLSRTLFKSKVGRTARETASTPMSNLVICSWEGSGLVELYSWTNPTRLESVSQRLTVTVRRGRRHIQHVLYLPARPSHNKYWKLTCVLTYEQHFVLQWHLTCRGSNHGAIFLLKKRKSGRVSSKSFFQWWVRSIRARSSASTWSLAMMFSSSARSQALSLTLFKWMLGLTAMPRVITSPLYMVNWV